MGIAARRRDRRQKTWSAGALDGVNGRGVGSNPTLCRHYLSVSEYNKEEEQPNSVYDVITRMEREDFMCDKKIQYKKKKTTNPLK
jgi:hypothetical protein